MEVDEQPELSADAQMATKLVRYAMACEHSRTVIRREGIKDKGWAGKAKPIYLAVLRC
jgi:hypothetical protein